MEYREVYVAMCGKPYESLRMGVEHEKFCEKCRKIKNGEKEEQTEE